MRYWAILLFIILISCTTQANKPVEEEVRPFNEKATCMTLIGQSEEHLIELRDFMAPMISKDLFSQYEYNRLMMITKGVAATLEEAKLKHGKECMEDVGLVRRTLNAMIDIMNNAADRYHAILRKHGKEYDI